MRLVAPTSAKPEPMRAKSLSEGDNKPPIMVSLRAEVKYSSLGSFG